MLSWQNQKRALHLNSWQKKKTRINEDQWHLRPILTDGRQIFRLTIFTLHACNNSNPKIVNITYQMQKVWQMWHDKGEYSIFIFNLMNKPILNGTFWSNPHLNWTYGCRDMTYVLKFKTIHNISIYLLKPVTQKKYSRHPTHSSWSCHKFDFHLHVVMITVLTYQNILFILKCSKHFSRSFTFSLVLSCWNKCDAIKQNESEVEKNQIWFFGICYLRIIQTLIWWKPYGDWAIGF